MFVGIRSDDIINFGYERTLVIVMGRGGFRDVFCQLYIIDFPGYSDAGFSFGGDAGRH